MPRIVATAVLGLVVALAPVSTPAQAHEFWIEPHAYTIPPGGTITADIRVGQNMSGPAYGYVPPNFVRFDMVQGRRRVQVTGRMGDRPALQMEAPGEGLWILVHQTTDTLLTYREAELFVDFVTHKAFPGVLETHAERGLPPSGFRERYSRYAKSLVAVGSGEGADREVGLLTEIVALANPYTDDVSAGLPVLVLYEGEPRADAQVEVFAKAADGSVEVSFTRTDAEGRATVPVSPGHSYLVDAVVMRPLEAEAETDPVWESLWAALTFAVPGR